MKKNIIISLFTAALLFVPACNYLEVVPDNTVELSNLFETKSKAYRALADCYSYMPNIRDIHASMASAGDEWVGRLDAEVANNRGYTRGSKLMRDWNSASDPILGFWTGAGGASDLYEGIRICNIFLNGLNPKIPKLSEEEYLDWTAQVKVLKAYYHFYLLRLYGPIVLVDRNFEPYDDIEDIRQERQTVETCFQFILKLIDEALYDEDGNLKMDLPDSRNDSDLGQIDRLVALSLRAKILLYRASPFYNGNKEYYANFKNSAGEPFFPQEYDPEKWKEALDAIDLAITKAEENGKELYTYKKQYKFWDQEDAQTSGILKYCYNDRFAICDQWNSELIWGMSNVLVGSIGGTFSVVSNTRDPNNNSATGSWQWMGASYRSSELFYTKNGVPITEDKTFDYANRLEIVDIPDVDYHRGYMQPGEQTVKLYLDREPRFYAWMATDRCIWRDYDTRLYMQMRYGEIPGGRNAGNATDYYWTGIAVKKYVHPESRSQAWQRVVYFPYPMIRLADLYLMYAEAYNEYYGPGDPAYAKIDAVRARSGLLRPVKDLWNDGSIVKDVGKAETKEGLRDIIQTERMIELSFEGQTFYDVCRWKRGADFYNLPVQGWNAPDGDTAEKFYQLQTWQQRVWITPKSYLMPIPNGELDRNPKLVQNPGY